MALCTFWSRLPDGLSLALLKFSSQLLLDRVANPWDHSDRLYPVICSWHKKLIDWVSKFRTTGPQLNFMIGCHSCQSSIYYTKISRSSNIPGHFQKGIQVRVDFRISLNCTGYFKNSSPLKLFWIFLLPLSPFA